MRKLVFEVTRVMVLPFAICLLNQGPTLTLPNVLEKFVSLDLIGLIINVSGCLT